MNPAAWAARAMALAGLVGTIRVLKTYRESTPEHLFNPVQHDWLNATQFSIAALAMSVWSQPPSEYPAAVALALVALGIQTLALWVAYYSRIGMDDS